ncbi:co-chaperone YbbN [Spirosoma sp. KNUC1025]|uniref:thioredoxin family protein n=1 Tax=Spirosoma sp. KNUC1025 TaxID=2894082 RepID=UPI003865F487|nr:thioredoxin family protein [Spirosoma sp. KNUC1025]
MRSYSPLTTEAPKLAILLVFTSASPAQRVEVDRLLEKIKLVISPAVQIIRVSEAAHPEVVRSFEIRSLPTLILLKRGQELWRYSGAIDNPELLHQLGNQMEQPSLKIG